MRKMALAVSVSDLAFGMEAELAFTPPMSESVEPTQPAPPQPIHSLVEKTADGVRKNPVRSVVWAFFIGLLLTIFPIGRVIGALTGLALILLRPVLLLLGAMKLYEEIEERRK
jgi:hypothetical protein